MDPPIAANQVAPAPIAANQVVPAEAAPVVAPVVGEEAAPVVAPVVVEEAAPVVAPVVVAKADPVAAPAVVSNGPVSETIERHLGSRPTLMVKQTRKGCLQEMMGCEAQSEFQIATKEDKEKNIMYALEDSNFLIRLCYPANRGVSMQIAEKKGDPVFLEHDMPCHAGVGACCCFPTMTTKDPATGAMLGKSTAPFQCSFAQQYNVYDANNTHVYHIAPPLCLGGCCIDPCDKKHGNSCMSCKIPFYIYPVGTTEDVGNITKEWRGMSTEIFTDADTFSVQFPEGVDTSMKATLMGTTFLIDFTYFESQKDN
jgi:hypothetical protein